MVIAMTLESRSAKDIFVELIGTVPPEQWDERLAEACHGNEELRRAWVPCFARTPSRTAS